MGEKGRKTDRVRKKKKQIYLAKILKTVLFTKRRREKKKAASKENIYRDIKINR